MSSVLFKASVIGVGTVFAARIGTGRGAMGMGALLPGLMLLLALVLPTLGSGFVSVPHDAITSVAIGPIPVSPLVAFVAIWAVGVLVMLLRLLGDVRAAAAMVRAARQPAPRASDLLRRASTAMGCRRIPALRETTGLSTAALIGFRRPVLLLPAHARRWSDEELFGVLCHELEHARRNDWLLLMVERVIRAIFWINPLVHFMARQAAAAREMVADAAALRAGTPAQVYAGRLIAVARELRGPPGLAVSVPFARGGVDERIRVLFDSPQRRPLMSPLQAVVTVMPLVMALAAFEPWTCLP